MWSTAAPRSPSQRFVELPPAFQFKLVLAQNPGMLGRNFVNIRPILRTPVFILETPIHPVHADLVTNETIRLPYPSIILQMQPFDATDGETYVFVILDSRIANIPGLKRESIISILTCVYEDGKPATLFDVVVDVHLVDQDITYYNLSGKNGAEGEQADPELSKILTLVANLCMSSLYAMTNDLLHYQMAGVRQAHRDRRVPDRKLGEWGWTYRLIKIDAAKHARSAVATTTPSLGGTHAPPCWHTRRGHWRHLRNGKEVWVRHCEVGQPAHGVVTHDYLVKEGS